MGVIEVEGNAPDAIAAALIESGVCRIRHFVPSVVAEGVRAEALALDAAGAFATARMGSGASTTLQTALRSDRTLWLDDARCTRGTEFLAQLHALSQSLRQSLRMPIHGVEAHYAIYPPGGRYIRHMDRMQSSSARMVSWVTYLNPDWVPTDGGMLRLYADHDEFTDIAPGFGTSVCFLSELEHEVLESHQTRLSIAGWMRRMD